MDPSYDSYRKYAELIGSPVLDYETWASIRHKLDKREAEADRLREKWLANERDVVRDKIEG